MFVPVLHTRLSQINRPGIQVMVLKTDRGSFTLINDASNFENHWPEQHKLISRCSPATARPTCNLWRLHVHRHNISWGDRAANARAQFTFWRHPASRTDRSPEENYTYACTHRPLYLARFKKSDSSVGRDYWPRFSSGRNARIWHNAQLMPTRGHLGCVFM